jgi:SSS family solute:Na+ symporter
MSTVLIGAIIFMAIATLIVSPRRTTVDGFFRGVDEQGAAPSLLTLVLSQVTTWIFARSLMNAAILGYYYGIAGTVAYAAYYLSFFTGTVIIDQVRFRHGFSSIQSFLTARHGRLGSYCYNIVVAVRLLSEVFANLIVIGLIFGGTGSSTYIIAVIAMAVFGLGYSMMGGLRASLRTDVVQMLALLIVLIIMSVQTVVGPLFDVGAILSSSPDITSPGWVLLAVAGLQVLSYPMHDPVMMDRGFIADRRTTRLSFVHAGWISVLCVLAFGMLGVIAGLNKETGEAMLTALNRLFGEPTMVLFNIALIVSAISTLDSTLSSAAKLAIADMRIASERVANGRIAMVAFTIGGLGFLFLGSKDLFGAVAVSGTASLYLAPVIVISIFLGRTDVPSWSYVTSFIAAIVGASLYFLETNGYTGIVGSLTGAEHKYAKLLYLCVGVLIVGFGAYIIGIVCNRRPQSVARV